MNVIFTVTVTGSNYGQNDGVIEITPNVWGPYIFTWSAFPSGTFNGQLYTTIAGSGYYPQYNGAEDLGVGVYNIDIAIPGHGSNSFCVILLPTNSCCLATGDSCSFTQILSGTTSVVLQGSFWYDGLCQPQFTYETSPCPATFVSLDGADYCLLSLSRSGCEAPCVLVV